MKRTIAIAAVALTALSATAGVNQFANGSFEDPVTMDGAPFIGFWEAFSGGPGASSANSTAMARTGAQSLELSISNTPNTFAGAFQDVGGLSEGQEVIIQVDKEERGTKGAAFRTHRGDKVFQRRRVMRNLQQPNKAQYAKPAQVDFTKYQR